MVPYPPRGEIDARGVPAQVIAWTARSGGAVLSAHPGLGPGPARDRRAHPRRLRRPERAPVPFARALPGRPRRAAARADFHAGHQGLGGGQPRQAAEALNANPSYVFFRELPGVADGPPGALGVPLAAEYSLAVDRRSSRSAPRSISRPRYPITEQRLERMMAAQDTGGAIRGVVRADFFFGTGADAGVAGGPHAPAGQDVALWPARRAAAAPRLAALVEQVLEIFRRKAAAHALAVGKHQRGRAVDGEAAPELEHLVDRIAAALAPRSAPWALVPPPTRAMPWRGRPSTTPCASDRCSRGRITGYMKTS